MTLLRSRYGTPDDFRYLVDAGHRVIWTGCRRRMTSPWRASMAPVPRIGPAATPDWGTYVFNFGRREVRSFPGCQRPLYWRGLPRRRSALTLACLPCLDYSRWHPSQYGGRENLEAIDFIKARTITGITPIATGPA